MEPYYRQKTGAETSDAAELARATIWTVLRLLADLHRPTGLPRPHAPRGDAVFDAPRRPGQRVLRRGTQNVPDRIPTRSVGTRGTADTAGRYGRSRWRSARSYTVFEVSLASRSHLW
jgi:hypothetical protein